VGFLQLISSRPDSRIGSGGHIYRLSGILYQLLSCLQRRWGARHIWGRDGPRSDWRQSHLGGGGADDLDDARGHCTIAKLHVGVVSA
jgi:hypothetical protein